MLRLADRRVVIVGGGSVAVRRARAMIAAGGRVRVVAPSIDDELRSLPCEWRCRPFEPDDLEGAFLVVVATDDAAVNQAVAGEARRLGVLCNRADDPEAGDFVVPAHSRHGPITLAVHSGGVSAAAAARIRDDLARQLDPDWPVLLRAAAPYRAAIQTRYADQPARRRAALLRLTDERAMNQLKRLGPDGLEAYLRGVVDPEAGTSGPG